MGLSDNVFAEIFPGMRRLSLACDRLVSADAVEDGATINRIDQAIVPLIKDCGKTLSQTILTRGSGPVQVSPAIALGDVAIPAALLPSAAPATWAHLLVVPGDGGGQQGNETAIEPWYLGKPVTKGGGNSAQTGEQENTCHVVREAARVRNSHRLRYVPMTNWNALLGCPRAVRMVVVQPWHRVLGPHQPPINYELLYWRAPHIEFMEFGELDSYKFCGLCRLIPCWTPETWFHYIIGATGPGRQMLRNSPSEPLSPVNMVWIDNDESTCPWMLCNRVQDDPLDLMVYCYPYADDERPVTPECYWQAYLGEDKVKRRESEDLQTTGQLHYW
ncbi:hypothetical protein C7212DRAFT_347352 [Tuber magnatum]|uniref:Uncharacterized protein n=1 Tax=Tuber magnatum TaxID=42249 RepID=A0A317SEB4_9PEZI|nr:hypothetical protein C7212DRAFT_347352 [Tuber magnatum]